MSLFQNLCAAFVTSVPRWWILHSECTTETQRAQRTHRGKLKLRHSPIPCNYSRAYDLWTKSTAATRMFLFVEAVSIIRDGSGSVRLRPMPRVTARCSAAVCLFPIVLALAPCTGPDISC